MTSSKAVPSLASLLADSPTNWGRWGEDDEVGALNTITAAAVLDAAKEVQRGKVFTLGGQLASGHDPVWPGRIQAERHNTRDRRDYVAGSAAPSAGGLEFADDEVRMALQGTTHVDALGHTWYDDRLYNGYPADTTAEGLDRASVLPLAERGVVTRGVLADVARHLGKDALEAGDLITLEQLLSCLDAQGVEVSSGSALLVRTGVLGRLKRENRPHPEEDYSEPGLSFSPELVQWFRDQDISCLATDTLGNEATNHPSGAALLLHAGLMRNLGVVFCEVLELDELADDCAEDSRYSFLYLAAPLKVVRGTGAPVNPVALK